MDNTVSLTVHKNTIKKRRRKELSKEIIQTIKDYNSDFDGIVVVSWDNDNNGMRCNWSRGNQNLTSLPDFVKAALQRSIMQSDALVITGNCKDPDDAS